MFKRFWAFVTEDRYKISKESKLVKLYQKFYRLSNKQKVYLFRQLSYLIESGFPVELSLKKILPLNKKNKSWSYFITKMIMNIKLTGSLIDALDCTGLFKNDVLYQVRGGELSGQLSSTLMNISDYYDEQNRIRRNLIGMMVYPAFLILMLFVAVNALAIVILPTLLSTVESFSAEISPLSQFVINVCMLITKNNVLFALSPFIIIVITALVMRIKFINSFLDEFILTVPIIGKIVRMNDQIRYARTFEALFNSGIRLDECLDCAASSLKNAKMRRRALKTKKDITKNGVDFSVALGEIGIYDETEAQLIYTSTEVSPEKTCEVFRSITKRTAIELEITTKAVMDLLGPIVILILALVIGIFAMGLISPMYQIIDSV